MLFVGGFGILNNVFIIVLALKYTTKKNLHHLILNMAVADALLVLAILVLEVPFLVDRFIWAEIKVISGDITCQILSFFVSSLILVSNTTLAIITIERFRASRLTVRIAQPYTLKQRLAIVGCSWVISGVLAAHDTPYRAIEESLTDAYACKGSSNVPLGLVVLVYTILFIAFCGIVILTLVTLRRLSHRQEIEANIPEAQRKTRAKRISAALKMVLSSLFLYSFCYSPFFVWDLVKVFGKSAVGENLLHCYDFYIFGFLIGFLPLVNSCFGPFIHLIFLSDFRDAAKIIICRNAVDP